MGEVLGIGMPHAPHLQFTDEDMANLVRRLLRSNRIPEKMKVSKNWPAAMREEWGHDEGLSAAQKHRSELVQGLRAARAALDKFKPDFVLIWGDDQYENFREDLLTPFCVYVLDEIDCALFQASKGLGASKNVWGEPTDKLIKVKCHQEGGDYLVRNLIGGGYDVAWSYRMHHAEMLGHAFLRTVLYLDYDRKGFDFPIVPFHVNCYGSDLRIPAERLTSSKGLNLRPPPSPFPWRCYDLGKEITKIIQESPWRVAVVGSSSWSHGSLTAKHHFIYPDTEADRQRLAELKAGELQKWRQLDPKQMRESGQHEMLNWLCLAGAMEGRKAEVLAYGETYLFNSDKAIVLFPVDRVTSND